MTKIKHLIIPMILVFMVSALEAQETNDTKPESKSEIVKQEQIKKLNNIKDQIRKEEKEFLKQEIENINIRLDRGDISPAEADTLKNKAAEKRAQNIENRIAIIDNKIALIERNETSYVKIDDDGDFKISIDIDEETESPVITIGSSTIEKPKKYDRRTTVDFVFAAGLNNAIIDGQIDDSPYRSRSTFWEIGWAWKTRVFNNSNAVRFKYGFSVTWNKLNIKNNQYLVNDDGNIILEEFPQQLNVAKYRMTNLVLPVHFEFGPSRKKDRGSYIRYSTRRQFKIGVGGYAGLNLQTRQKLKYDLPGDGRVKEKIDGAYRPSHFIYGLSGYVGIGNFAFYCKYDLNPIFRDQAIEQNNISLGVRFDFD